MKESVQTDIPGIISRLLAALLLALIAFTAAAPRALCEQQAVEEADTSYPLDILVNRWNYIPDGMTIQLVSIGDGHKIDVRAYDDYMRMMADCRDAGLSPKVRSSYRTRSHQVSLYNNKVKRLLKAGMDQTSALAQAMTVVAYPGTSEHQLGLALDIVDTHYQELETAQENTEVQKWLMNNSWRYGFILRYPSDKCTLTGIIYEPWHYRYVGHRLARELFLDDICLEEYVAAQKQLKYADRLTE